jgi:TolB-like protein
MLAIFFCGLAVSVFSQNTVSLDAGLEKSVAYFESRIAQGTKVAVLNMSSLSPPLAEYVIEEIVGCLVNSLSLTLVDRSNLELLRQEMNFQYSGEVSDETALSLGKILGAQTVVTGSINLAGNVFRLRIRAIDIETGVIQGQFNANIAKDRYLAELYDRGANQEVPGSLPDAQNKTTPNQRNSQSGNSQSGNSQSNNSGGGRVRLPDYLLN